VTLQHPLLARSGRSINYHQKLKTPRLRGFQLVTASGFVAGLMMSGAVALALILQVRQ
jgi:hypothetical protein